MAISEIRLRVSETEGLESFRLAMRSTNLATFRGRILQATNAYSAASDEYRSRRERGAELRCRGWIQLLRFFLATKAPTKKQLLDESWRLTKLALHVFSRNGNDIEFASTYDQLATSVGLGYDYHWDLMTRLRKIQEGIDYGRRAIRLLSPSDHGPLLTRICVRVALFLDLQGDFPSHYDVDEIDREALGYLRTAEQLDKRTALLQMGYPPPGFYRLLSDQEGAQVCNNALRLARESGDNFAVGWLLDQAAVRMFFDALRHLDDAEKTRVAREALRLAEEAQCRHSLVNFVTPNCGVIYSGSPYVEHFKQLSLFEKDPAKRRALLKKSLSETPALFRVAQTSGYPVVIAYAQRMASSVLLELAGWAASPIEKRRMLKESLKHCIRAASIVMKAKRDEIAPVSTVLRYLSQTKAALADLEPNHRDKVKLLRAALKDSEKGVFLYTKYLENISKGQPHILGKVGGRHQLDRGDLLARLYNITKDEALLPKIARAYSEAANTLMQGEPRNDLGLAYWKAAEAYDLQQANVAAAEYFGLAAKTYQSIKDKNPRILSIFREYANYMEAWSNIEHARAAHRRYDHDEAETFYDRAAALHRTAGRWSFLAPYYAAFARLESAENLSRTGDSSAATKAFGEAAERFRESAALLKRNLTYFDEPQEKSSVEHLAASFNEEYCRGRMLIEEARQAEDQGDHQTSAERFCEAAQILAKAAQSKKLMRDKNDLLYISTLAKAWEEIARSYNTRDSSLGFQRAILFFEKSLNYGPDENAKSVSLGHKYFCQALAASDEFTYTLSPADYENAAKHFTAASTHFARAGFNVESTHVQACKFLLDAHAEVAKSSKDPERGGGAGGGYLRASKILGQAAEAFARSHQSAKQRQVLNLLESVNERQGFPRRLVTTSKLVSRVSPTVSFPTPVGGEESPVGHSRFTGPNIDVDYSFLTIPSDEKTEVLVELRVANIGTEPIQIVQIESIVPETTRPTKVPPNAKVAYGSIIPDRKNTASMNVETFQLVLDAGKGPLIIKPKIVYVDEKGQERTHELAPKVIASSPLLDYLAKEFMTDYGKKGLALQHSGWRTLTSIVASLRIPRSHLYGDMRFGHVYGAPLKALVKSGIVECRTFPGERGRGGQIRKARLAYETEIAKQFLSERSMVPDKGTA